MPYNKREPGDRTGVHARGEDEEEDEEEDGIILAERSLCRAVPPLEVHFRHGYLLFGEPSWRPLHQGVENHHDNHRDEGAVRDEPVEQLRAEVSSSMAARSEASSAAPMPIA